MKPWGPNNQLIHVVHLRAPESKLPSIIYLSGLGISMHYVKPLLLKFVEFMDEPVEVFSFDFPGYGASESRNDYNTENLESELLLLRQVFTKSRLRKPFILIGGSLGGLLVHLYYLTYPEDVAGIILLDPTPSTVFERESPVVADMDRTERIATELQIKVDTLTNNVTNLETNDIKTKESLGSIKHNLLEIDENYVKDKDKLVQEKTNISNQHEQASVRSYK
ncbi:unnamed protein product [Rotaria sordida]|uniref:AB hydrolase-1 domain-containing protein n=1 Tax=Rotaria sordida TaxID=392033 RepID=A0A814L4S6_9BILA|nr:unnamed protein product [Rotaria sordida]CAF1060015.1 unnamed protein product [Rotaria sordida]CAF1230365.1 unnamed protein product [Rotaria sordida]CAF4087551.1 unnamed protein product [Rotaria sordida]